jgi:hypothetical protein
MRWDAWIPLTVFNLFAEDCANGSHAPVLSWAMTLPLALICMRYLRASRSPQAIWAPTVTEFTE